MCTLYWILLQPAMTCADQHNPTTTGGMEGEERGYGRGSDIDWRERGRVGGREMTHPVKETFSSPLPPSLTLCTFGNTLNHTQEHVDAHTEHANEHSSMLSFLRHINRGKMD